jgi:hypothetical protein
VKRCTAPLAMCTRRWRAGRGGAQPLGRWRQISLRWRRGGRRASGAPAVLRPLCVHHIWAGRFESHEQAAAAAARLSGIAFRLAHAARLLVWSRPATAAANVVLPLRLPHDSPSRDRKLWRGMIGLLSAVLQPLCERHLWTARFEFHEQAAASAARLSGIAFRLAHPARLLVSSRPATAAANVALALRLPHGSPSRDRKLWRGMIGLLSTRSDATPTKAVDRTISRQHVPRTPAVRANGSGIVLALARRPARVAASIHGAEASHQFAGLPASTPRARAERPRLSPPHPVLLHWRKEESAPSFAAATAAADATSAHALPRANATAAPAISSAPAAAVTHESLRKQPLDSGVADRLVDDVVRRLDKRLRVERERRGL